MRGVDSPSRQHPEGAHATDRTRVQAGHRKDAHSVEDNSGERVRSEAFECAIL